MEYVPQLIVLRCHSQVPSIIRLSVSCGLDWHPRLAQRRPIKAYVSCVSRQYGVFVLLHLEAEDLVVELADEAGLLVAQGLGSLLHSADHGRRAAEKDLDVVSRGGELGLFLWC